MTRLYLDIETVPDYGRKHLWENLDKDQPGYLSPALVPEHCKVASMAWAIDSDPQIYSRTVGEKYHIDTKSRYFTEWDLLDAFWELVKNYPTVIGFSILGFDLPVLLVRSQLLGIAASRKPFDTRPWGKEIVDLREVRKYTNRPLGGLKAYAHCYGIQVPVDDVDGSQFEKLLIDDPARAGAYNRSDVFITRELDKLWRGYWY